MDNQEDEEKVEPDEEKADSDLNNEEDKKKKDNKTNEECDTLTRKRTQRQRTCSSSQKDKSIQLPNLYVSKKNYMIK